MFENDLSLISAGTRHALDESPRIFVDGEWNRGGHSLDVVDPSSGKVISTIAEGGADGVNDAVAAARHAFERGPWSQLDGAQRQALLLRLADLMERDRDILAELEVLDVGMPIWLASQLNVGGAIDTFRYMAGLARRGHGKTMQISGGLPEAGFFGYTQKEPVGVVGAIVPWNVPVMIAAWKLAPALAAGCTVVIKPSEEASLGILYLARLVQEAGFPAGAVNIVTGGGAQGGEALASHPGIDKLTFTGSTATGKKVARAAAENVTKLTLELGGKSPQILFPDADLTRAIQGIANSIFANSGQVCAAGSRLYIHRDIYAAAIEQLARHADALQVGAGLLATTQLGPLVNARQRARVLAYIDAAEQAGAVRLTADPRLDTAGFFVRPTVLTTQDNRCTVMQEEVFGPVLTVMPFEDTEHAIALANDTIFGLSASLWTRDIATMHSVVPRIRSGRVAVNTEPVPWPGLPEGGRRASGYGRDLGDESFESYLEGKSVLLRYA
ncbi:aldehyde dehydrogenase family protein [Variovorax sp. LT1R16]|uniref:aldehyde dehydrogenase family protein n=1 Tax=Variovorax sp. LT1R16 TaxID=3443728 RepID=UPI003F45C29E